MKCIFMQKQKKILVIFHSLRTVWQTMTQWNEQCETLVKLKRKRKNKNKESKTKNIRNKKENMLRQQKKERNDI